MSEYDSILKEKQKVEIKKEEIKKFPKFLISFILITITLIISYIIYFNNILSPKNILEYDYLTTLTKYSDLIKNIPSEEFNNENNLVGIINYNQEEYKFNLIKNNNNLEFNLSNNDKYLNYYTLNNNTYLKVPSIEEYVSLNYTFSINHLITNCLDKLSKLDDKKFIKTTYLDNKIPTVEINFSLNKEEINDILGLRLEDDYEVIATLKNSAIMNKIKEIKVVINNKTKQERKVITIIDNQIIYKTNNETYKLVIELTDTNFIIKINKDDILYSVITGTNNEDSYQYTYQIIDKIYNITLLATKTATGYTYELKKKQDEIEETITINLLIENSYVIENNITNIIDYKNELISDKYKTDINYFKDKLLNFIKDSNKEI